MSISVQNPFLNKTPDIHRQIGYARRYVRSSNSRNAETQICHIPSPFTHCSSFAHSTRNRKTVTFTRIFIGIETENGSGFAVGQ